jgi:hypothetical protein
MKPRYTVVYRTCECVSSVHSAARPFGLSKPELARACFESLRQAMGDRPCHWIVVGDRLDEGAIRWYHGRGAQHLPSPPGNDASLRTCLRAALEAEPEDWIYFCEDDYLHRANAFDEIQALIEGLPALLDTRHHSWWRRALIGDPASRMPLLFLPDYPDRYLPRRREPGLLFHSERGHWREVRNLTFSVLLQGRSLRRLAPLFERAATGARDKWLSRRLCGRWPFTGPCIALSPLPGLSTHMHDGAMTPLVDWEAELRRLRQG